MAATPISEPTVATPDTPASDDTDRTPRRVRLPSLRRGRGTDTTLFDQDDGAARPVRRIALPLLRRGRIFEAPPFEPTPLVAVGAPARESSSRVEATHRLEGFELRSVAGIALQFYASTFAVLAIGVVLVWIGVSMLGIIGRVEEFMRSIGFRGFRFAGFEVVVGSILLCVAAVAFLTVMTVLAAAFLNLLGRHERGVRVRLVPISRATTLDEPSNGNGNGNGNGGGHTNANGKANGTG